MSQIPDFRGTADINLRLSPRLISHNRIIQPADRAGYPYRNHTVNNNQRNYHQQHEHNNKIPDINHSMSECGIRNHPHKLPAGIAYGIYNHRPVLPFKGFVTDTVSVLCGDRTVFTCDPVAYLNLARMIDNLPVAVTQIVILPVI